MHPKNKHNTPYNFKELAVSNPSLSSFIHLGKHNELTIDFSDNKAVIALNKALLIKHYSVTDWNIPEGYLCPPIPGRADYTHYIADLLNDDNIKAPINGLDIGVGANCIYPILGQQIYQWTMVGSDINNTAVLSAKNNIEATAKLKNTIDIRQQTNNADIFKGIIKSGEKFQFSMCNPPFHSSKEDATKGSLQKLKNLSQPNALKLNFGGQANELWCNGGEALFIKRMIKQSVAFKTQVTWFTCLVSKAMHLPKIYKQLNKLPVSYKTIDMTQGHKNSRFIAWKFK